MEYKQFKPYHRDPRKAIARRTAGVTITVNRSPGLDDRYPAIRIAGKWLRLFGFDIGDSVVVTARQGEVTVKKSTSHERR